MWTRQSNTQPNFSFKFPVKRRIGVWAVAETRHQSNFPVKFPVKHRVGVWAVAETHCPNRTHVFLCWGRLRVRLGQVRVDRICKEENISNASKKQ